MTRRRRGEVVSAKAFRERRPMRSRRGLVRGLAWRSETGTRKRKQFCPVLFFSVGVPVTASTVRDWEVSGENVGEGRVTCVYAICADN
jgi:hypothetical protein